MASRSSFEEDLSCPVCFDIFINPVVLSCSHSICEDCVQRFWESKRLKECPVCRRCSKERPLLNLALKNLCETYQQKLSRRSSFGGESVCGLHKEKLKLFCLDDQEPVCLVCRDSRKHTHHRFSPVDEAAMDNKVRHMVFKKKLIKWFNYSVFFIINIYHFQCFMLFWHFYIYLCMDQNVSAEIHFVHCL